MPSPEKPTLDEVIACHSRFIRTTLARLGVRPCDLDDVAQLVHLAIARGLDAFDPNVSRNPPTALRSWIFGICERQAASHHRAEAPWAEVPRASPECGADQATTAPHAEARLLAAERNALLTALIAALEPSRQAILIAHDLEGVPMEEIAAQLGIRPNTAWNRVRLARRDLRDAWRRLDRRAGERR